MEKSQESIENKVHEFYKLIESDKFKEARDYFKSHAEEITSWELLYYEKYAREHPNKKKHHIEYNKSFPKVHRHRFAH